MIDWIRSSIIAFKLRKLEVRWDELLHNSEEERRIGVDVGMMSRGDVVELFNPSIHLP